jgi:porphobilinogen synthase
MRLRRLRYHPGVRDLVRHVRLSPQRLILPLFVRPGENLRQEIGAMPGNFQLSPDL